MLLIPARARPSAIHGLGLFADRDIAPDELIWAFRPGFDLQIPESVVTESPAHARDFIRTYATFSADARMFYLSSDDDRFTNHSAVPNTYLVGTDVHARCAIPCGTEITADYAEIGMLFVP